MSEPLLETGWILEGSDGSGQPLRLAFGETELARAYLGVVVGRHPALADRVIDDPTVSRRHLRIGITEGQLFAEDLNSLNGTLVDEVPLAPFQPTALSAGEMLRLGRVRLHVARLDDTGVG